MLLVESARRYGVALLNLLWPPFCPRCHRRALHPQTHFCEVCWQGLRAATPSPVAPAGTPEVHAAWRVDEAFLEMLAASKYRGFRAVGRRLAREAALRLGPLLPPGVLIPVPLTRGKRRERGFNQAADLGRALREQCGRALREDWLIRRRAGGAVAGRTHEERLEGVSGVFAAGRTFPGAQAPPLILLDDVLTTGATAGECLRTLHAAGARVAAVAVMARAASAQDDVAAQGWEVLAGW